MPICKERHSKLLMRFGQCSPGVVTKVTGMSVNVCRDLYTYICFYIMKDA